MLSFNLEEIFNALNSARVDYVVVGGCAMVLHGFLRATADLDLVVSLEPANARRAIDALSAVGLQPKHPIAMNDFLDAEKRREWSAQRQMIVLSLWDPTNPVRSVDVFVEEPIEISEMLRDAVTKEVEGVRVPVASVEHLIAMKRQAGRTQDFLDIEYLKGIRAIGTELR